jgi:tRNA (5-methylaminomethyl-2-thiouridylate)-methyltransferase
MSGGVDSSTAAALLKQEGNEVIGIGLRLPEPLGQHNLRSCCNIEGMNDARGVAAKLDIPFYVLNYEKIFEKSVIDYFCQSYLSGKTPNPCIECNRAVKFGHLLKFADSLGADYVATGHYANICYDQYRGRFLLKKGLDAEKDQSYFLYSLSQKQLSRILFPLSEMTKEETRKLAKSFGLEVHDKPGSQDICFLGQTDYRSFLTERFPEAFQRGPVLNTQGDILGWHQGVICYTVGQRKGLGIAARKPLYVLSLDVSTKRVMVGTQEEAMKGKILITGINWIAFDRNPGSLTLGVKIRYRQPEISAYLMCSDNDRGEVWFSKPQKGIAPGQAAVFYDGDVVVGGGIIE